MTKVTDVNLNRWRQKVKDGYCSCVRNGETTTSSISTNFAEKEQRLEEGKGKDKCMGGEERNEE